mgnify:CR=1 FL=1
MLDMLVCKNSIWWASNPLCTEPYFNAKHFFCFSDVDDCALLFRYENCKRIDKPLISEYKYKCIFKIFLKFEDSWYSLKEKTCAYKAVLFPSKGSRETEKQSIFRVKLTYVNNNFILTADVHSKTLWM